MAEAMKRPHSWNERSINLGPGLLRLADGTYRRPLEASFHVRCTGPLAYWEVRVVLDLSSLPAGEERLLFLYPLPPQASISQCRVFLDDEPIGPQPRVRALEDLDEHHQPPLPSKSLLQTFGAESLPILSMAMESCAAACPNAAARPEVRLTFGNGLPTIDGRIRVCIPGRVDGALEASGSTTLRVQVEIEDGNELVDDPICSDPLEQHTSDDVLHLGGDSFTGLDRDIEVTFRPGRTEMPVTRLRRSADNFLFSIFPPTSIPASPQRRDLVFCVDASENVDNGLFEILRDDLASTLRQLDDNDRFALVTYGRDIDGYQGGEFCDIAMAEEAIGWMSAVEPKGRADIQPLLARIQALPSQPDRQLCIFLLAAGHVGNEPAILKGLDFDQSDRRYYAVGIGPSMQQAFLRRLALLARGRCEVAPQGNCAEALARLLSQTRALLTEVTFEGEVEVDSESLVPSRMGSLTPEGPVHCLGKGSPSALRFRSKDETGVFFAGTVNARTTDNPAMSGVWAGMRVREMIDSVRLSTGAKRKQLRSETSALAREHGILVEDTVLVLESDEEMDTQLSVLPYRWKRGGQQTVAKAEEEATPAFDWRKGLKARDGLFKGARPGGPDEGSGEGVRHGLRRPGEIPGKVHAKGRDQSKPLLDRYGMSHVHSSPDDDLLESGEHEVSFEEVAVALAAEEASEQQVGEAGPESVEEETAVREDELSQESAEEAVPAPSEEAHAESSEEAHSESSEEAHAESSEEAHSESSEEAHAESSEEAHAESSEEAHSESSEEAHAAASEEAHVASSEEAHAASSEAAQASQGAEPSEGTAPVPVPVPAPAPAVVSVAPPQAVAVPSSSEPVYQFVRDPLAEARVRMDAYVEQASSVETRMALASLAALPSDVAGSGPNLPRILAQTVGHLEKNGYHAAAVSVLGLLLRDYSSPEVLKKMESLLVGWATSLSDEHLPEAVHILQAGMRVCPESEGLQRSMESLWARWGELADSQAELPEVGGWKSAAVPESSLLSQSQLELARLQQKHDALVQEMASFRSSVEQQLTALPGLLENLLASRPVVVQAAPPAPAEVPQVVVPVTQVAPPSFSEIPSPIDIPLPVTAAAPAQSAPAGEEGAAPEQVSASDEAVAAVSQAADLEPAPTEVVTPAADMSEPTLPEAAPEGAAPEPIPVADGDVGVAEAPLIDLPMPEPTVAPTQTTPAPTVDGPAEEAGLAEVAAADPVSDIDALLNLPPVAPAVTAEAAPPEVPVEEPPVETPPEEAAPAVVEPVSAPPTVEEVPEDSGETLNLTRDELLELLQAEPRDESGHRAVRTSIPDGKDRINFYRDLVRLDATQIYHSLSLARAYREADQTKVAVVHYQKYLRSEKDGPAYLELADAYDELGKSNLSVSARKAAELMG